MWIELRIQHDSFRARKVQVIQVMKDTPARRSRPRSSHGARNPLVPGVYAQRVLAENDEPTHEFPRIRDDYGSGGRRAPVKTPNGRRWRRTAAAKNSYQDKGPRGRNSSIRGSWGEQTDGEFQTVDAGLYARQMAGIAALVAIANEVAANSRSGEPSRPRASESARAGPRRGRFGAVLTRLRQDHMMLNSLYLMLNSVLQAGFGFSFWIIAAHLFSASDVGTASALISATSLIGYLALLGLNNGMGKYLPTSRDRDALVSSALAVVAACGAAIAVCYIVLTPLIAPRLAFVEKSPELTIGFALITAASALNFLTDSVFIASRRAKYTVLVDGIVGGLGKNILAVLLAGAGTYALFAASAMGIVFAAAASVIIIFAIMGCRPRLHQPLSALKPLLRFSTANYVGNVFNMLPTLVVPVIVLDRQGAAAAGYFFVVFQIASIVYAAAFALEQTFLAEGSRANANMRGLRRRSLRILVLLCVPAVLGLIAVGRWLLLAFGSHYYQHGLSSLIILALAAGPVSANYWLLTILRIEGKLRAIIVVNATYALAICAFAWVGSSHGLTGVALAWLAGALIGACAGGAATAHQRYARRRHGAAVATGFTTGARPLPTRNVPGPYRDLRAGNPRQRPMRVPQEQRW